MAGDGGTVSVGVHGEALVAVASTRDEGGVSLAALTGVLVSETCSAGRVTADTVSVAVKEEAVGTGADAVNDDSSRVTASETLVEVEAGTRGAGEVAAEAISVGIEVESIAADTSVAGQGRVGSAGEAHVGV